MKILILNGPNLNLLGTRDPHIYGSTTMDEVYAGLVAQFPEDSFDYCQSNVEGELINMLHTAVGRYDGIVFNAGGYTHTSVAIADAVAAISVPVVEVHISNIAAREPFRHTSLLTPHCLGSIIGFGIRSYALAVLALHK